MNDKSKEKGVSAGMRVVELEMQPRKSSSDGGGGDTRARLTPPINNTQETENLHQTSKQTTKSRVPAIFKIFERDGGQKSERGEGERPQPPKFFNCSSGVPLFATVTTWVRNIPKFFFFFSLKTPPKHTEKYCRNLIHLLAF